MALKMRLLERKQDHREEREVSCLFLREGGILRKGKSRYTL